MGRSGSGGWGAVRWGAVRNKWGHGAGRLAGNNMSEMRKEVSVAEVGSREREQLESWLAVAGKEEIAAKTRLSSTVDRRARGGGGGWWDVWLVVVGVVGGGGGWNASVQYYFPMGRRGRQSEQTRLGLGLGGGVDKSATGG